MALGKASALTAALKQLEVELLAGSFPEEARWKEIQDCKDVAALVSDQTDFTDEQAEIATAFLDAKASILDQNTSFRETVASLEKFIKCQWPQEIEGENGKFALVPSSGDEASTLIAKVKAAGLKGCHLAPEPAHTHTLPLTIHTHITRYHTPKSTSFGSMSMWS